MHFDICIGVGALADLSFRSYQVRCQKSTCEMRSVPTIFDYPDLPQHYNLMAKHLTASRII